ncbi:MAG: hypothetical protein R2706_07410 [Acidimicrobiales bacterium]
MANYGQKADLSTADYLKAIQRYPWLVALPVLVLGFLAWFLLGRGAAVYEASAEVLVQESQAQQDFAAGNGAYDPNFLRNEVSFAESDVVRNEVAARVGIEPFVELKDVDVTITASETSEVLTFTAQAATSAGAAEMANSYAESYVSKRREAAVSSYDESLATLEQNLEQIRATRTEVRTELDAKIVAKSRLDPETSQFRSAEAEIVALETALQPQLDAFDAEEAAMIQTQSDFRGPTEPRSFGHYVGLQRGLRPLRSAAKRRCPWLHCRRVSGPGPWSVARYHVLQPRRSDASDQ